MKIKKTMAAIIFILIIFSLASALADTTPAGASPTDAPPAPTTQPQAVNSEFVIVSYRILSASGYAVSSIQKGDAVNIELLLKNTGVTAAMLGNIDNLDVTKIVDSFTGSGYGSAAVESQPDAPLLTRIVLPNCTYSGSGQSLRLMVGIRSLSVPYVQLELAIRECSEYSAPQATPAPAMSIPAPALRLSRSEVPTLAAGDSATVTLYFTNYGSTPMAATLAYITTSDGLLLMESASSFPLGTVNAGQSIALPLRIKGAKAISAQSQSIQAEIKFSYYNGESVAQGSATDKVNIIAKATEPQTDAVQPDNPAPNLILQKCDYGQAQIAAGTEFDLALEFFNTSDRSRVENVVMTVETGDGLAIRSASNTFYYPELGKKDALSQTVLLQALPNAKPGVQELTIGFKYEYVDNKKRSQGTFSQKISIPVFQPDRFEIGAPTLPQLVEIGQEASISLSYVNKGKSEASNVQAELIGEVDALVKLQSLGNIEPGKSGNISFVVTPQEEGDISLNVKLTYEDASGALKTKEIPVSFTVSQPAYDPAMDEEIMVEEEAPKMNIWLIISLGAGGAAIIGIIIFAALKKRRKKAKKHTWDDGSEA